MFLGRFAPLQLKHLTIIFLHADACVCVFVSVFVSMLQSFGVVVGKDIHFSRKTYIQKKMEPFAIDGRYLKFVKTFTGEQRKQNK